MKVSQKGLYALQAMMLLARRYSDGTVKIKEIAKDEKLPEKFLELILLELKRARIVESIRGAKGGYRLKRSPVKIFLGEIIRTIDGPLAPFGDAESQRRLVEHDQKHRLLFSVFLAVRNAASGILDHTSLADIARQGRGRESFCANSFAHCRRFVMARSPSPSVMVESSRFIRQTEFGELERNKTRLTPVVDKKVSPFLERESVNGS
jgi:Rrf2 family transcriptional regulator, cysteine metabolism repressor